MTLVIVDDDDLACMDCNRPLIRGQVYSERLIGVCDDTAVVDVVCLGCATRGVTS